MTPERIVLAVVVVALSALASGHALLFKRDPRSAIAWVVFIWLLPTVGPLAYLLLGINRIQRRALALRVEHGPAAPPAETMPPSLGESLGATDAHLLALARATGKLTTAPLRAGNRVVPLASGDEAYPAMTRAIDEATRSVALGTYIFDADEVGRALADALARAHERGVAVRVLVDDAGRRYSLPSIVPVLRARGVPVACFLPTLSPLRAPFANLRNHRKVCVVDGCCAFTGGLNIRDEHVLSRGQKDATADTHFKVEGPAVAELFRVFAEDWRFAARETLEGAPWRLDTPEAGPVFARVLADGPADRHDPIRWTLLSALSVARRSVRIATPYFIPDQGLITALGAASLRGIEVDVLLPERGNIRLAEWAQTAMLWQTLEHGCRVYRVPPPFDHSKLMVVDEAWALLGSANWDARSLRLNFELDLECYDRALATELTRRIDERKARARPVTLAELDGRSLPVRLRDGAARLLAPFL
ncbi:MAG: PLDc N-terminal domain-containing protein [Deltaproteobacteria bacterium]|nr:PLDc N-terminal domain-containing protein [Deltaproteobacteria bacterium]